MASEYSYDDNGRLLTTQSPLAVAGGYDTAAYTYLDYDSGRGQYYNTVANALGMTETVYVNRILLPVETVDVNGMSWYAAYDEFGRLAKTWGPGERESSPGTEVFYKYNTNTRHRRQYY